MITFETTLVDHSRPTAPAGPGAGAHPHRSLPTTVHLPDGTGPAPLIVFSHGLGGGPQRFATLHRVWAEAGYVVAAPRFPLTSDTNPDHHHEVLDLLHQPGDVSFVLDELLAASAAGTSPLAGRVDPDRLGAAGLSLGGATTYGLIMNEECLDERVRAAVVMAGAVLLTAGGNDTARGVPVLALHGDADLALPYAMGRAAWESLGGPAWLVTLLGGDHADPFEDTPTRWDTVVHDATTAFWNATLGSGNEHPDRITDVATDANGLVTIEARLP